MLEGSKLAGDLTELGRMANFNDDFSFFAESIIS